MKNKLIIPADSPFGPIQRAKINDIWIEPPIGIKSLSGGIEFPDLIVSPNFNAGRHVGSDARGISLKPVSGKRYEIVVLDFALEYQKSNPRIVSNEIQVERGEYILEPNKKYDRYALSTRVSPTRCEMTYRAVINIEPENLDGLKIGRLWASEEILKREEKTRKWSLEHPPLFGGFF